MNTTNLLLLPAIVKRAKDAARAVKQGVHTAIHQIRESTLTILLDLPHFEVFQYSIEREADQDILHLFCHLTQDVGICPHCNGISTTIKQYQDRCVRHIDVWGKRTFLHFRIRRFECPCCHQRFTEELTSVGWRRRQTHRFEQVVYQHCLNSSQKETADHFHLSQSTVSDIFKKLAKKQYQTQSFDKIRYLGIDEIALKKRHKQYALVISDIERHTILAVLPDREQKTFIAWLNKTFTADNLKGIQVVSIDMWRPYRSVTREYLPQADIVADRFHVMRNLNDQLTKARRQIQQQAPEDVKVALKGSRWLLVRNRNQLTQDQEQQLLQAISADSQLREAYLLKEEFRLIFERLNDREQAKRFLKAWIVKVQQTRNKYLLRFVNTLTNWWCEILNYFYERITNGFVEGMNRAIRAVIWRAYGFRNFENFRLLILAKHGSTRKHTIP